MGEVTEHDTERIPRTLESSGVARSWGEQSPYAESATGYVPIIPGVSEPSSVGQAAVVVTPEPATPAPEPGGLEPDAPATPAPDPPILSGHLWEILTAVFGDLAGKWYRIADCETGYKLSAGKDPAIVNAGAANWTHGYFGIFQIAAWLHGFDEGRLLNDIAYGAQAAFNLSRGGTYYRPWPICGFR